MATQAEGGKPEVTPADGEHPKQRGALVRRRVNDRFRRENPHFIRHHISVTVARLSSRLARSIPTGTRYWIADRMGDVLYILSPRYRRNVTANLGHVYRSMDRPKPTEQDVKNVFRISSRNWADLLVVPGRSPEQFKQDVYSSSESIANLDRALALGKGCVLITAHVGAFDYMGHFLHACGYKLTIVTGRTTARIVFDGVTHLRQSNGLSLVEATPSGIRRAIQTVMQGDCSVIVTDRDFFQNGIPADFFGDATTLPPGAIRIARDTGAAIVPVFGKRLETGHELAILEPILVPRTPDLTTDLDIGMRKVVASMEIGLKRAPDQWVMFQRVWPSEEDDSVA